MYLGFNAGVFLTGTAQEGHSQAQLRLPNEHAPRAGWLAGWPALAGWWRVGC